MQHLSDDELLALARACWHRAGEAPDLDRDTDAARRAILLAIRSGAARRAFKRGNFSLPGKSRGQIQQTIALLAWRLWDVVEPDLHAADGLRFPFISQGTAEERPAPNVGATAAAIHRALTLLHREDGVSCSVTVDAVRQQLRRGDF